MMEIWQLEREAHEGTPFPARYETGGAYEICAAEDWFRMRYVPVESERRS